MINYNDNPILVDVNSKRSRKEKILCVLCNNEKIQLECINPEENRYKCPRCKNTYQPNFEILPQEDILESSHDDDDEGPVLISSTEDNIVEPEQVLNANKKSDIPIPDYMKNRNGVTVEYEEHISE